MATADQELDSFANYARQQIESGGRDVTLDELFDTWRAENPSDALRAENTAAINASLEDFDRGERGTLAGEHSDQLRRAFGMADE